MLARLTMSLLDVYVEFSTNHDENASVVDLVNLHVLLPLIPDNAWSRVARSVVPMCTNIQHMISNDLESVAQLLLELELRRDDAFRGVLPTGLLSDSNGGEGRFVSVNSSCSNERPTRKRRRPAILPRPLVISSTHSSFPTIVITLAPPQVQETSCRVPYQDQAFGNLLTVPSHPAFNKAHPPMTPGSCSLPQFDGWKWENGHWEAVLPTFNEQRRRGMYSKANVPRKKSCRSVKATLHVV